MTPTCETRRRRRRPAVDGPQYQALLCSHVETYVDMHLRGDPNAHLHLTRAVRLCQRRVDPDEYNEDR
jgi:hypothetical protein